MQKLLTPHFYIQIYIYYMNISYKCFLNDLKITNENFLMIQIACKPKHGDNRNNIIEYIKYLI